MSCDGLLQKLTSGELTAQSYFGGATYPHKVVETGADGTYEIELEEGRHNLYAYRDGYAPASLSMIPVEDGRINSGNDLELGESAILVGSIYGADGKAVPDAVVTAIAPSWGPRYHTTTSDETGRFRLANLPRQGVLVEAHHFLHGSIVQTDVDCSQATEIRLIFQAPARLEFALVEARQERSVPRCTVTLAPREEGDAWRLTQSLTLESQTGAYSLGGITPGVYFLTVAAAGLAPLTVDDVLLRPGDLTRDLKFALPKGGTVSGRVTTVGLGTPVPGTKLSLYDWRRPPKEGSLFQEFHSRPFAIATASAEGVYILERVPAGRYWLRAEHPSFVPVIDKDVRVEEERQITLDISLPHGGTVFGRTPWPFTDVVVSSDAGIVRMTFSDQAGEFEIFGFPAGRCLVKAGSLNPSGRSYLPKGVVVQEHATSTVRIHFRDELTDEDGKGLLFGWVMDDRGQPVANAQVYCQNLDDTPRYLRAAKSDEAGVYYFQGVAPGGKYVLVLAIEGDKNALRLLHSCQVRSDTLETRVDLVRGTGEIRARVRAGGKLQESANVRLYEAHDPQATTLLATRTTDASGEAIFTCVSSGKYTLEAVAAGFCPAMVRDIVPAKGASESPAHALDLQPAATLELRFVGKDGSARTGWTALVVDAEGKSVFQFLRLCDDQGVLRIEGLTPGKYRIAAAERSGRQEPSVESTATAGATTTVTVTVE